MQRADIKERKLGAAKNRGWKFDLDAFNAADAEIIASFENSEIFPLDEKTTFRKRSNFEIFSHSAEQTEKIAACLIKHLKAPATLLLEGDLGAGKTCFVRGLVQALDPKAPVSSPTYAIAQTYETTPRVHHVDLYRVQNQDLEDLGILEMIEDPEAIVCIEWPKIPPNPPFAKGGEISVLFTDSNPRRIKLIFSKHFSNKWLLTVKRDLLSLSLTERGVEQSGSSSGS